MNILKGLNKLLRGGKQPPLNEINNPSAARDWTRRQLEYWQSRLQDLQNGELSALSSVYCLFAWPDSSSVVEALAVCTQTIEKMNATQIVRIEEEFRQKSSMEWFNDWRNTDLQPILRQCQSVNHKAAFLGLGSFHPNGYYRQRCVEAIADLPDFALPYLLLRLNDWAPKVAKSAQKACQKVIVSCSPEAIILALSYLRKADLGSRSNEFTRRIVYPALIKRLQEPESKPCLKYAFQSPDLHIRRMCFQLAIQADLLTEEELLGHMFGEHDPMTRLRIVKTLLQDEAKAADENLLSRLLQDKSANVRVFVLQKLYSLHGTVWDSLAVHLLDSSARVREFVQFLYRQDMGMSLAEFYREHLQTAKIIPAIFGLGETGDKSDIMILKSYLDTPGTKQVQAVLRAVARLGGAEEEELYFRYLFDARAGVAKRAFLCLQDSGCRPDGERIFRALTGTESFAVKKRLLQLICNLSYWDYTYYMLLCVKLDDVGKLAKEKLCIWRGTFLAPSKAQLERCMSALEAAKPYLDASIYHEYEFGLEHAKKSKK